MSRIVVVDDHPVFRKGLVALLRAEGHDVVGEAADGVEAVTVVAAELPDVVLMDLSMPLRDGFETTGHIVPNHLISQEVPDEVAGRALRVKRLEMYPIECVARGYLSGSGWREYRESGAVCGIELPEGLRESEQLPEPIFTPATKAEIGDHDENISFERAVELVGVEVAEEARRISLEAYRLGADHAAACGILIADTKFELGFLDGRLALCDEVLTPDSSRFWPAEGWGPGDLPPSLDKQPVRDFLESTGWDKTPPPPSLPPDVVAATTQRYREAYERLSGRSLDTWPAPSP